MGLLLFKAPEDSAARIQEAGKLASVVDAEYHAMTGKVNKDRNGNPVVVAMIEGDGYWYLRFNDPEFAEPQKLRDMVKRWENTRFMS